MSGCGYSPPAVPVSGDATGVASLAGEWSGSYVGRESGRSGSIFFRLSADADTAHGDVLMAPTGLEHPKSETERWTRPEPSVAPPLIAIRFVRAEDGIVHGQLDEYRDPTCGCRLKTTFTGRIRGDEIEGTFTTLHLGSGERHGGRWEVRRTGEAPAPERLPGPEPGEAIAPPDSMPDPGLKGPTETDLVEQGSGLYVRLGCAECHERVQGVRVGPDLEAVADHRSFEWIYHMILAPDSMLANDPTARSLLADYAFEMPDVRASPWEALVLYEYLVGATLEDPPPGLREP
jgi:hypothetical protein